MNTGVWNTSILLSYFEHARFQRIETVAVHSNAAKKKTTQARRSNSGKTWISIHGKVCRMLLNRIKPIGIAIENLDKRYEEMLKITGMLRGNRIVYYY